MATALLVGLVAGTAGASAAATKVAGPPSGRPPTGGGPAYAAPTPDVAEVVLGQMATPVDPAGIQPAPPWTRPAGLRDQPHPGLVGTVGRPDDLRGAPGCAIACITSGVAYARGPGARLVVTTDVPVFMRIAINGPGYTRFVESADGVTSFGVDLLDMEADTTYEAVVTAWDAAGFAQARAGTFTTLERHVEVTFGDAHIIERPFETNSWTAEAWVDGLLVIDDPDPAADADTVHLPAGTALDAQQPDGHLDVVVDLSQHDGDQAELCEVSANEPGPGGTTWSECTRWATASTPTGGVDVDQRPGGATSWTEWTVQTTLVKPGGGQALPPGYGSAFSFQVPVTLEVTYE